MTNLAVVDCFHSLSLARIETAPQLQHLPQARRVSAAWYTRTVNQLADRITVDPEQCGGRPCVRGMRIRVSDVLDLFAAGLSAAQVLEEMPDLEAEDLGASLRFASRYVDHPVLVA